MRLVVGVVALGATFTLASCTGRADQEQATPLGCDEAKRHYYDPGKHACVTPSVPEEARVLATLRRVYEVGSNGGGPIIYRISFARSLKEQEFLQLVQDLDVTQVISLQIDFTDLKESFGYNLPLGIKPAQAAQAALEVAIRKHDGRVPAWSEAFAAGRYTTWFAEIEAQSTQVGPWWERHWKDVTVVQPIVSNIDKVLPVLEPYRQNKWER